MILQRLRNTLGQFGIGLNRFSFSNYAIGTGIINNEQYRKMYDESIRNSDEFWRQQGKRIDWFKDYTKIQKWKFDKDDTQIEWYSDGKLNVSYNCIDRHLKQGKGNQVAIIWEGNDPNNHKNITYQELHDEVCRLANGLKELGVKRGDRVSIYMPMIPEIAYAMLACTRIGAIHSVIFGGFSEDAIANRINDCDSEYIITSDESVRGNKIIPMKSQIDKALTHVKNPIKKIVVVQDTKTPNIKMEKGRDIYYSDLVRSQPKTCEPEVMDAESPLFILYTSGSTGNPKGVLHTTGGYLVYASMTHEYVFGARPGDVFWCTADCGWITGHNYILYGPLANGVTTVMFEGIPTYPDASRFWKTIDKHKVSIFYTAPTALRSLMREGDHLVTQSSTRDSLRVLGSVGEPINPEAWQWYYNVVGKGKCFITDTWWQTETGGIMISPIAGAIRPKPGSAALPFFGVQPVLLDQQGNEIQGAGSGFLAIKGSWPSQMRTVYKNHQRFCSTYFSQYNGYYFTGDGCKRDEDGYYWITGRVDDVIIVSGHNLGTTEIESALVGHPSVAEAAVVGYPHDIKGNGIYAYVTLKQGVSESKDLEKQLQQEVRKHIGPIASPDFIQFTPALPKTRSGKIMRRILRKVAENELNSLGDVSTLADPSVVQSIIQNRKIK